jgi:hypothetical protein
VKRLGIFYTTLIAIAVLGGTMNIAALYHWGSASVPGWRGFFQPGPLSVKHASLGGKCESCHTPTQGVQAAACIACHSTATAVLRAQPAAFHANIQDCRGCHVEHQGAARPTRMDHAALLRIGSHLALGAEGHPGVLRQMANDIAAFLGIPVSQSAEKNGLACTSCHSNSDPHRELFGRDCASCHDTATWRIAGYLHPSPTSRDCAQCHQAPPSHSMMHFELVSKTVARQPQAQVNQCFLCHWTNSWNDIKGVGWYKHH